MKCHRKAHKICSQQAVGPKSGNKIYRGEQSTRKNELLKAAQGRRELGQNSIWQRRHGSGAGTQCQVFLRAKGWLIWSYEPRFVHNVIYIIIKHDRAKWFLAADKKRCDGQRALCICVRCEDNAVKLVWQPRRIVAAHISLINLTNNERVAFSGT